MKKKSIVSVNQQCEKIRLNLIERYGVDNVPKHQLKRLYKVVSIARCYSLRIAQVLGMTLQEMVHAENYGRRKEQIERGLHDFQWEYCKNGEIEISDYVSSLPLNAYF